MKISHNLFMLEVGTKNGNIHPSLIWDGKTLTLVDTGFPGQFEEFKKALEGEGFYLSDIGNIIFTHQDMDHVGLIREIQPYCPDAAIWAHQEEAPYIDGREIPVKWAAMVTQRDSLPLEQQAEIDKFLAFYKSQNVKISKTLGDKEHLPFCGGVEIIHIPGHTPGHICLFVEEAKTLITGDALNMREGRLTGPNPQFTLNMELALRSLHKLLEYDIQKAVVYHGGLFEGDFKTQLEKIIHT